MQPRISFGNAKRGNVDWFVLAIFMRCGGVMGKIRKCGEEVNK